MAAAWLAPNHTPQEAHGVCLAQDLRAFLEVKARPQGKRLEEPVILLCQLLRAGADEKLQEGQV